jgi:hypothetical protein
MFRAHAGAGHKSHLPLGSARALEAQNNADSDTNELVLFSAGKRAEEKGGPGRHQGPTALFLGLQLLCTRAGWGRGWGAHCLWDICLPGALYLPGYLQGHVWQVLQPCSVPMAILGWLERQTQG